jgi:hypothetical protein
VAAYSSQRSASKTTAAQATPKNPTGNPVLLPDDDPVILDELKKIF